jgi:hypothetical protein
VQFVPSVLPWGVPLPPPKKKFAMSQETLAFENGNNSKSLVAEGDYSATANFRMEIPLYVSRDIWNFST